MTFAYSGSTHMVTRIEQRNTTAGSPGTAVTRVAYPAQRRVALTAIAADRMAWSS